MGGAPLAGSKYPLDAEGAQLFPVSGTGEGEQDRRGLG